jgi:hypothetical protein
MRRLNMAKKIFTVSLVLGLALAGMAFANGQKEPVAPVPGQAPLAGTTDQRLVVTGSVSIGNLIHPTIKSGDKVYELLVPRSLVYRSGIKEGAQVTVEGYLVQGMPMWQQGDDGNLDLFVTKATIDGKDYDLSQYGGRMAGAYGCGPRGGWTGSRGYGYGRGPMMGGWGYGGY